MKTALLIFSGLAHSFNCVSFVSGNLLFDAVIKFESERELLNFIDALSDNLKFSFIHNIIVINF